MLWTTYVIILSLCGLILNYLWCKRKFYYLSWNMNGPIALPLIGNAWMFLSSSDTMNIMSKAGKKFGSPLRFWLGTRFVMCIFDPDHVEAVLTSDTQDKGDVYDTISELMGGHGLLSLNGYAWKSHRKLLNPTVQHYNILNSFYPTFHTKINILIKKLEARCDGATFDIYKYIEQATADIVCNTTFGTNMKLQEDENQYFLNAVNDGAILVGVKTLKPWYQYKIIMWFSKYYEMNKNTTKTIKEFVRKIYNQKLTQYNNVTEDNNFHSNEDEFGIKQPRNFINECIRLTMSEKYFKEEDSIVESLNMLLAGFETTAVTIANVIMMLAMHPEYQDKIYNEIQNIVPPEEVNITSDVINQLQHTDRVIKETLRLFPTIPLITRITRNEMKIGDQNIPAGTEIILSLFELQRMPSIWGPNADKFNPNNFLPENVAARHPRSFVPFAYGARNCIGLRYANIVLRLIVASLVRNFIFTTEQHYEELKIKWMITLKLANGFDVKLRKRNSH